MDGNDEQRRAELIAEQLRRWNELVQCTRLRYWVVANTRGGTRAGNSTVDLHHHSGRLAPRTPMSANGTKRMT